ncbi:MAG: hypothetical protein Q3965_00900 [Rothia sp. (in: high G+C Gram-positive bacteria)]|nr:hypothetical protein [Rothia sp. (in: high G+C Gram-positive bacteria)]
MNDLCNKDGAVLTEQLKNSGWSEWHIYKNLQTHSRGIRVSGDEITEPELAELICALSKSTCISHVTAARIHGLRVSYRLPQQLAGAIHVLYVGYGNGAVKRKGVKGFRTKKIQQDEVVKWREGWVTSVERTIFDLATYLDLRELIKVIDGAINFHTEGYSAGKTAQTSIEKLRVTCSNHPGERGVKKMRLALELARVGSDSALETETRLVLEDYGLKGMELNRPIYSPIGVLLFQPDIALPFYKISIQCEGTHHDAAQQRIRDIERARRTREAGWVEIRASIKDLNEYVFDSDRNEMVPRIVAEVRKAISLRREAGFIFCLKAKKHH